MNRYKTSSLREDFTYVGLIDEILSSGEDVSKFPALVKRNGAGGVVESDAKELLAIAADKIKKNQPLAGGEIRQIEKLYGKICR